MVERRSGNEAAAAQTQAEFSTALRNTPMAIGSLMAQQLTESDLPRRFADLVEQVVPAQFRGEGGGSSGLSTHGGGAGNGLDSYTLLTKVAPSQTSTQCPCCMENFGEGEMMRVLPVSMLYTNGVQTIGCTQTRSASTVCGQLAAHKPDLPGVPLRHPGLPGEPPP
eukprot:CAMPEP_0115561962 /NCGR_PEP_ID=MMETSP0271-20121206/101254_1 /TAXON_ID=71861 /ORGANISM="Scrippsiella trochoidea, Strain CCMP3099" /LENGTH=165 /DNA_ID=CAMNT_0002996085 /DNA_START=12 /DNA_END=507 /DNA_ORIENTATION=-